MRLGFIIQLFSILTDLPPFSVSSLDLHPIAGLNFKGTKNGSKALNIMQHSALGCCSYTNSALLCLLSFCLPVNCASSWSATELWVFLLNLNPESPFLNVQQLRRFRLSPSPTCRGVIFRVQLSALRKQLLNSDNLLLCRSF